MAFNIKEWLTPRNMKTAGLVLATTMLVLGALAWKGGDERAINRRLTRMRNIMEKKADEKPLAAIARTRELMEYLAPKVEMHVGAPLPSTSGRQELIALVHQFRSMAQSLEITIRDRSLTIASDRRTAVMRITVEVVAEAQGSRGREIRELELEWEKESGAWLLRKIALVESIRRPVPLR